MGDLADLYQRVVIEHNRAPHNYRVLDPASHRAQGINPLCGDRIDLFLTVRDGVIQDIGFQGDACAIATASASLLTLALSGLELSAALSVARCFEAELGGEAATEGVDLGDLGVLLAVRNYPGREKCARLPWRALEAALSGQAADAVTTEIVK